MAATMKDIAIASGVSRSVVSLVFNNRDREIGIAPQTRERILRTARELGYCRNELARAVVTGHSRVIAWISSCDPGNHEYIARISAGISRVLSQAEYSMKTYYGPLAETEALVRQLRKNQIAGVICHATGYPELQPLLSELKHWRIPVVIANLSAVGFGYGVVTDDASGIGQMVDCFVNAGFRKLAYLGSPGDLEYVVNRRRGFVVRSNKHRLKAEIFLLSPTDNWQENVWHAMDRIYKAGFRGVVAETDAMAAVIMQWAVQQGLSVPREMAVSGFADMSFAPWCTVPLTTVSQPLDQVGATAAGQLLKWIGKPKGHVFERCRNITLPVEAVIRQSIPVRKNKKTTGGER